MKLYSLKNEDKFIYNKSFYLIFEIFLTDLDIFGKEENRGQDNLITS